MSRDYSNVIHLEGKINTLFGNYSNAMRALNLVVDVMCVENGFKRDDGSDYYTHCADVTNTLISHGIKDEDIVCAALLHDIIEDVEGYKEVTIKNMFNARIAHLVQLLTKEHDKDYHIPENLEEYIENIRLDRDAAAIKTADRMHNMMTLNEKSTDGIYRKVEETRKYYLPFFAECSRMYPRYGNLFEDATAHIGALINIVTKFYTENQQLRMLIDETK